MIWNPQLIVQRHIITFFFLRFPFLTMPLCTQGSLLHQLAIANESLGGGIVVVMAERDKEEMELDIAKMEFNFKGTSVICRSGSPLILADLKKVCLLCLLVVQHIMLIIFLVSGYVSLTEKLSLLTDLNPLTKLNQ